MLPCGGLNCIRLLGQREVFVFLVDFNRFVAGKPSHSLKRGLPAMARFGAAVIC